MSRKNNKIAKLKAEIASLRAQLAIAEGAGSFAYYAAPSDVPRSDRVPGFAPVIVYHMTIGVVT